MIFIKMAAPLRLMLLNTNSRKSVILCVTHFKQYSRDIRQPVVNILNSEEEASKLKKRKIVARDPRLQVDFNPRDPVKRNLPKNDKKSHRPKDNKNTKEIRQPVVNILNSEEEASELKTRNIVARDPRLQVDSNQRDPVKKNLPQNDKKSDRPKDSKNKKISTNKKFNTDGQNVNQSDVNNPKNSKKKNINIKGQNESDENNRKKDSFDKIEFDILGDDKDGIFGKAVMKARSKSNKDRKYTDIILEGKRLILDALYAGGTMKELYFSGKDTLSGFPALSAPVYKVSYNSMKIWSDTETPAGLLAIFERPKEGVALCGPENPLPVTLIMDQVRDPGNMGTLIRSAAAVGCQRILALKGCVSVWESKVLRAGAGSHFRVPIISNVTWDTIQGYISESPDIYIADLHRHTDKRAEKIGKSSVDSQKLEELFDAQDKKLEDQISSETDLEADVELDSEKHIEVDQETRTDDDFNDMDLLKKYENAPLPVKRFQDVEYSNNKPKVLIIGGESSGISIQARKLAFDNWGTVITIPMCAGVNSLNTSIAGSILLYEMLKHLNKPES